MAILMYPKRLLGLMREAYPQFDEKSCIRLLVNEINPKGGGVASRKKAAFLQEKPIIVKTETYQRTKNLAEKLAKMAGKDRTPKLFLHNVSLEAADYFNMSGVEGKEKKYEAAFQAGREYAETLFSEQEEKTREKEESSNMRKLKHCLSMADAALCLSTGIDGYYNTAKNMVKEALWLIEEIEAVDIDDL